MARTGLMYSVAVAPGTVSAGANVIELRAASASIIIHEVLVTAASVDHSKTRLSLQRRILGTGGTSRTPVALHSRNTVAAATAVVTNNIAGVLTTTYETIIVDELIGWHWLPPPKDRIYFDEGLFVFAVNAVGTVITPAITIVWEEL